MALTNNNLNIIKALSKNDMHAAKIAALASLAEDTSKKNASVIEYYRKQLIGNASVLMTNLPSDLKTILVGESPNAFKTDRYFVKESDQCIVNDIMRMKLVSEEMALRSIPYKNTTLLHGQSGTGKTELARYIAYKLNLPFFYISFVATIDSYMGSTAKNIHKVFEFCNSIPCVLMLDELDCVATKRSGGGSKGADGELERTTITLMQELDRLPNHVTLIAATNRLDMVDEAMLRRFSIKHEVKNMSSEELSEMITQYLTATNTSKYVSSEFAQNAASKYTNPGQVMPELMKEIGKGIYEEKKEELLEEDKKEHNAAVNVWEVKCTWKDTVAAETSEDAIAIARNNRYLHGYKLSSEEYSAKRADFIAD